MRYVLMVALVVVGIIHLLPLAGVAGPERLLALYGVELSDPDLVLLMRHRAVLFGILGGFLVLSAFVPALQPSALMMGFTSVASFLGLALTGGPVSPAIARIVAADWVALGALVVGFVAYACLRQGARGAVRQVTPDRA